MFQKNFVEEIKTHILCSIFFSENRAVYEKIWEIYSTASWATDNNMAHGHFMREYLMLKTHPEYVILTPFPLQQLVHDSVLLLLYTYTVSVFSRQLDGRTGSLHLGPCILALCAPHFGIVSFRHLQRHSAPTGARDLY
jgi:hypothetical protein